MLLASTSYCFRVWLQHVGNELCVAAQPQELLTPLEKAFLSCR